MRDAYIDPRGKEVIINRLLQQSKANSAPESQK